MPPRLNILLIDDERAFRDQFRSWFGRHAITEADNATHALQVFQENQNNLHVVVLDYTLPPGEQQELENGLALLGEILKIRPNIPVIMATGAGDREIARQALQVGAYWYLEKPLDHVETEVLLNTIGRWHEVNQTISDLRSKIEPSVSLLGLSHAMVGAPDIDTLLERVTRQAATFLEADECKIVTFDEEGKIKNGFPRLKENQPAPGSQYNGESIAKELMGSGGYKIAADTLLEPGLYENSPVQEIRAFAAAACPQEPGAQAVLYAYFKKALSPEEADRLKTRMVPLARLTGLGLERLSQDQLNRALVTAGRDLLRVQSEADICQIVRNTIEAAFDVSTFYLALFDESSNSIRFAFIVDQGQEYKTEPRLNTDDTGGVTGYIIRSGREIDSSDITKERNLPVQLNLVGNKKPSRAYLGIPLQLPDGRVRGVISIHRYVPRRFLEPTKQALRTLAAEVALTLERMRLETAQAHVMNGLTMRPWQDLLREIAQNVKETARADIVTVHPYDDRRRTFTPERIRLGVPSGQEVKLYSGDENKALERLLGLEEHFAENISEDNVFKGRFVQKYGIASSGGVVLSAGQPARPVGVLVVNYKTRHHFSNKAREEIRSYKPHTALALYDFWVKKREDAINRRISAEYQAIRDIRDVSDNESMVHNLMETIKNAWAETDVEVTPSLMLADHRHRMLFLPEAVKGFYQIDNPKKSGHESIAFGEGLNGWVAVNRQSLLVPDTTRDKRYLKFKKKTKSELCVPVKLGDSLFGVLDIEASQKNFFEEADRIILEHIAEELAICLGASGRREDADKVITAAMQAASHPDLALDELTHRAFEIAGLRGGQPIYVTIFLASSSGLKLASAWPEDYYEKKRRKGTVVVQPAFDPTSRRGIVIRAFQTQETQVVLNVKEDKDYIEVDENTQAELAVPIFASDGSILGVINIEYADPGALTAEDRQLVETLASQTAVVAVLQNQARELAESQQVNNEATALAFMGIGEVEYGHGWKNAAATVTGTLQLLQEQIQGYQSSSTGRLAKGLKLSPDMQKFEEWTGRALNLTKDIQHMSRKGMPTQDLSDFPVFAWLQEQIERWRQREEKTTFNLHGQIEPNSSVHANRQWLTRALDNLVANATRACQNCAEACVTVDCFVLEGNRIRIEISDNGPGIPDEVRPYLFIKMLPEDLEGKFGWGIGCLIVQFIARAYGGQASLLRSDAGGTTTAIELPLVG